MPLTLLARPGANPLPRWQRRTLLGAAASLLLTGVVWMPVHYLLGAGAGELPHPVEPWLVRWHGLSAVVGVFAFGTIAAGHVGRGWTSRQRRGSGLALCLLVSAAIISGYALSYLVPESWHPGAGWTHAVLGVAMVVVGIAHRRASGAPDPVRDRSTGDLAASPGGRTHVSG